MAKKLKGKQKDEKQQTKPVPPEPEPIPIPEPTVAQNIEHHHHFQDEHHDEYPPTAPTNDSGGGGWGDNASYSSEAWGTAPQQQHQDTWGSQPADTWEDQQHLAAQPMQNNRALTPITEISSPIQSTRRQSLAASATYSADNWDQHQHQQPAVWGTNDDYGQQDHPSRTLTATPGDRSRKGSPPPHPTVSIQAAAMAAHHAQNQKVSSASEAARKFEESRAYAKSPMPNYHSDLHSHHELSATSMPASPDPPPKKPLSTASAYAREHSYTHRRRSSAPSPQSTQPPASVTSSQPWNGPKAFAGTATARKPAPIPPDPSWIHTGGNAWSNKARAKYSDTPTKAPDPWADTRHQNPQPHAAHPQQAKMNSMYSHDAWSQQFQHRNMHPQTHHVGAQHRKHHSYAAPSAASFTGHSFHGRNGAQHPGKAQNQSWEAWGKVPDDDDDDDDDYTDDDGTYEDWPDEGWGQHAGSKNGHQRGRANASEEWGQAGWGGHSTKGSQHKHAGEWGQQDWNSVKGSDTWGGGKADAWGQTGGKADAWGQTGGKGEAWGQNGGKADAGWGQSNRNGDTWGSKGDTWGTKGAGDAWGGKSDEWGTKGDAWGQKSGSVWGEVQGEWNPAAGQSKDAWGGGNGHANGNASAENGSKPNITPQQRSQILNALFLQAQVASGKTGGPVNVQRLQQIQQQITMIKQQEMQYLAQQQQQQQQQKGKQKTTWEAEDWNGMDELANEFDPNRKVHFSPKNSEIWGGSPRSIPSKTLQQAQQGMRATLINDPSNVRFLESQGAAMQFVTNAFFSNARFAKERLYWRFSPDKDPRVATMLAWVQKMSFNIGTYGLQKFIATRERGALFINVAFRMPQFPNEPAFDWLPFPILQSTMDKILQESVAFYNPLSQVVVFVFLPSESGQSVAIWRRKINIPEKSKLKYHAEASAILKQLPKETDYVVMVDELPKKQPAAQTQAQAKQGQLRKTTATTAKAKATTPGAREKKKRKWWKLWLG